MAKYKDAKYIEIMCCPDCGMQENVVEDGGMPERDDFIWRTDEYGVEYVECMCGCKFLARTEEIR